MSEPPDRAGPVELDPRYAFSASAVLEKKDLVSSSVAGQTSDVLSGIGSTTTSRISSSATSSPSVSPERPSLEDALSLDDDSSEGSHHKEAPVVPEQQPALVQQRGFLLPRSPARLFVHNAVVQSALSSVASSSAPVTLSDVLERVTDDSKLLDRIEQDLQDQLQVLERIENDLADGQSVPEAVDPVGGSNEASVPMPDQPVPATPTDTAQNADVVTDEKLDQEEQPDQLPEAVTTPDQKASQQLGTIDSGLCELMAGQHAADGQHTDQYSDAYITAVDSISSSDFGETPEPGTYNSPLAPNSCPALVGWARSSYD